MLRDFLSCCAAKSCVVFGKILISANKFGKRLLLKRQHQQRLRKRRRLLSRRRCSFCLGRRESARLRLRLPAQGMPTRAYWWHCRFYFKTKLVQTSGQNQQSFWAKIMGNLFGKMSLLQCPIQMRAAHYASFLPPKKRGSRERMGASWQISFE